MSVVGSVLSTRERMASSSARAVMMALRMRALLILVALIAVFAILTPDFLTLGTLAIMAKHIAIFSILAVGMTFAVLTGGIDLSVGSLVGLSGIVAGYVLTQGFTFGGAVHYPGIAVAIVLALLVSAFAGALNGWLICKANVTPFIATLGMLYIVRGAAMLIAHGHTFPGLGGDDTHGHYGFTAIGQGVLLKVPAPVWLALLIFAVAAVIAAKTPFGRHVYAVGGNERAARLSGVRVERVKFLAYIFSAVCAGVVGLIIASELEAAHPATGESFELNAIAAIVLGGTSLMGGRGTIAGSLFGACVIGVLADGLVMMGVSEFWQMVVKGVVIVFAVAIDQMQTRLQSRLLPYLLRSNPEAG